MTEQQIKQETGTWLRNRLRLIEYSTLRHRQDEARLIETELNRRVER